MNEHQIVAMITTIIECLKSNEVQRPSFIAQRYRAHLNWPSSNSEQPN